MLRGFGALGDTSLVVTSLMCVRTPTSTRKHSCLSDCLVLVGERKLRKELMLRSFCFRSEPIRPLRIEVVSLVGDSSLVSNLVDLATGEDGPGVSQPGTSFSFCLAGYGCVLDNVSITEQKQEHLLLTERCSFE
jgi:hypothetical protein